MCRAWLNPYKAEPYNTGTPCYHRDLLQERTQSIQPKDTLMNTSERIEQIARTMCALMKMNPEEMLEVEGTDRVLMWKMAAEQFTLCAKAVESLGGGILFPDGVTAEMIESALYAANTNADEKGCEHIIKAAIATAPQFSGEA
jgi:hypothetical protein